MATLNADFLKKLADQAAEIEDQTEVQASYDFETPPAGPTVARMVEYIEFGSHGRKPHMGKAKKDADAYRVVFELLSPQHITTGDDGVVRANRININGSKSLNDKATFKKLFNACRYGRDNIKHIAQMLGDAFVVNVIHNAGKAAEGQKAPIYANLRESAEQSPWLIGAPVRVDAITGTSTPYAVPDAISPIKVFIWDLASKETWDTLFIDGTREIKNADGTTTMQSKNYLQEKIMAAKNFEGSPIQAVLGGIGALPTAEEPKTAADPLVAAAIAAAEAVQKAPAAVLPTAAPVTEAPSPELVALLVQGVPIEEARKQLAAKAAPAPVVAPVAPVDPKVAALKAAGLTDAQIALALGGAAPENPTPEAPAKGKGRGKKNAAPAATAADPTATSVTAPATAPTAQLATSPSNVLDALAALNLTAA